MILLNISNDLCGPNILFISRINTFYVCKKIISEYIFEKAQLCIFFKFISFFLVFISWESGHGTDCINLYDRSYGV